MISDAWTDGKELMMFACGVGSMSLCLPPPPSLPRSLSLSLPLFLSPSLPLSLSPSLPLYVRGKESGRGVGGDLGSTARPAASTSLCLPLPVIRIQKQGADDVRVGHERRGGVASHLGCLLRGVVRIRIRQGQLSISI